MRVMMPVSFRKEGMMTIRTALVLSAYALVAGVSYATAYLIRFEFAMPAPMLRIFMVTLPWVLIVRTLICLCSREYKRRFSYVTLTDLVSLVQVTSAGSLGVLSVNYFFLTGLLVPRSVILLDWGINILLIGAARSMARLYRELLLPRTRGRQRIRAVIYGATNQAIAILRALQDSAYAGRYQIVGIIDETAESPGTLIAGIPVFSASQSLGQRCRWLGAEHVFLTSSLTGQRIRSIMEACVAENLVAKVVPSVQDFVSNRYDFRIRDVDINDLLRREPARLDEQAIKRYIRGKTVLVTGGAGSIGSELCRQITRLGPRQLVVVDQSESGVFEIQQELIARFPDSKFRFVVADIVNVECIRRLMDEVSPQIIFHAAAYKHVPLLEDNVHEAIRNNVFGTKTIADLADQHEVEAFVMVSTDKAVRPSSVMGRTKLLAENYVQALAEVSKTRFVTVRFGNVLNSVGSVVPIFRKQIQDGGPVTVTHPEMRRFFMTIPEAVQLVLQAGAIGDGGDVLVLEMGEPVKIVDLAREMIYLSGLSYPEDIDIVFTGLRPGEKLVEELFYSDENEHVRVHDKIFRSQSTATSLLEINTDLATLDVAVQNGEPEILDLLTGTVGKYTDVGRKRRSRVRAGRVA